MQIRHGKQGLTSTKQVFIIESLSTLFILSDVMLSPACFGNIAGNGSEKQLQWMMRARLVWTRFAHRKIRKPSDPWLSFSD